MKAPWRRFLDLIVESFLGRQPVSGTLGKANDVATCVLQANGELAWAPRQPGAGPGGGLDFVFQPAAAPGNPTVPAGASNIYQTEATLWQAVNATLATSGGQMTILVDSSLAPAAFNLPHNYQRRVVLQGASGTAADPGFIDNTLTLNAGAIQTDIARREEITVVGTSVAGPVIAYTGGAGGVLVECIDRHESVLANLGTHAMIDVPAGQGLLSTVIRATLFPIAGPIFGLPTATSTLETQWFDNTVGQTLPQSGIITGIGGARWFPNHDASWPVDQLPVPGFAGTRTIATSTLLDKAIGVRFDLVAQPAYLAAVYPGPAANVMTAEQAIAMHMSPVDPVGAAATIDGTQLDQTMNSGIPGIVYTCPAGFPIGREITLLDSSGGVGGNAFAFTPTAPETVGPLGAGASRVFTNLEATSVTLKKVSAINWRVIASTTLV